MLEFSNLSELLCTQRQRGPFQRFQILVPGQRRLPTALPTESSCFEHLVSIQVDEIKNEVIRMKRFNTVGAQTRFREVF